MKINSSLTMNWTASDTIATEIQVLTFFAGHLHMCDRAFSALTNMKTKYRSRPNVESDLRICLTSHIIGVRKKADSQKRVREAKSLGNHGLESWSYCMLVRAISLLIDCFILIWLNAYISQITSHDLLKTTYDFA